MKKSWRWTMSFPPQEYKLGPGNVDEPLAERGAQLIEVDERTGTVVVTRGQKSGDDPPRALAPGGPYQADDQVDAVFAFAERIGAGGLDRDEAGVDLLLRRRPRLRTGTPPLSGATFDLDRVCAQVRGLDRSALVIQGPPGTGKTWTGARIALSLMAAGRRVGVMATAHKAINNLLAAIDKAADETGAAFRGWRKRSGEDDNNYESARIVCEKDLPDDDDGPILLHAGTAWYWASDDAAPVDVLFVDEAGQVSLADAIAVAQAARQRRAARRPAAARARQPGRAPASARACPCSSTCSATTTRSRRTEACSSRRRGGCTRRCATSSRETMYDDRLDGARGLRAAAHQLAGPQRQRTALHRRSSTRTTAAARGGGRADRRRGRALSSAGR